MAVHMLRGCMSASLRQEWRMQSHAICQNLRTATSFSKTPREVEFTLSEYKDHPELGYKKGQEYCMLTLRHPALDDPAGGSREALYKAKDKETDLYVGELFERFAGGASGKLEGPRLKAALEDMGLRPDDFQVAGILQRHAIQAPDQISREEFPGVVREIWGRNRAVAFDDRLAELHRGVESHAPLKGLRALGWVGREAPIFWIMRLVKLTWPFPIQRVTILRNQSANPDLDPELMETCFKWVVRGEHDGLMLAKELAQRASTLSPTGKGGFAVRLDHFDLGTPSLHVPLRGLPENGHKGVMAGLWNRFTGA